MCVFDLFIWKESEKTFLFIEDKGKGFTFYILNFFGYFLKKKYLPKRNLFSFLFQKAK